MWRTTSVILYSQSYIWAWTTPEVPRKTDQDSHSVPGSSCFPWLLMTGKKCRLASLRFYGLGYSECHSGAPSRYGNVQSSKLSAATANCLRRPECIWFQESPCGQHLDGSGSVWLGAFPKADHQIHWTEGYGSLQANASNACCICSLNSNLSRHNWMTWAISQRKIN